MKWRLGHGILKGIKKIFQQQFFSQIGYSLNSWIFSKIIGISIDFSRFIIIYGCLFKGNYRYYKLFVQEFI